MKAAVTLIVQYPTPMILTTEMFEAENVDETKSSMKQQPSVRQKSSVSEAETVNKAATVHANSDNAEIV